MRYGSIRYANNLPVDYGLLSGAIPAPVGLEVVEGTPAELNAAVDAKTVDVSAVSAARLLSPHAGLQILPEATIASHGPVDSVLLVSKRPIDDLHDKQIAVSEESATGALLLRILLERDVGIKPRYATAVSGLDTMLKKADAALVIGDDALRASGAAAAGQTDPLDGLHVLDLGEAWRAYSGLPMVYALWVHQAGVDPMSLANLRAALVASRQWGNKHQPELIAEAQRRTGVSTTTLRTYYNRLTYTLGNAETAGLRRFAEECSALGGRTPITLPPLLEATT